MRLILSLASSTIVFLLFASVARAQGAKVEGFDRGIVPFENIGALMSNVLALLFFLAGLLTFFFIVVGGIQWITAGGDAKAAQAARDRITAAVVGLIVVVAAFAITLILGQVFGIDLFDYQFPGAEQEAGAG
jgi:hypothetical protein